MLPVALFRKVSTVFLFLWKYKTQISVVVVGLGLLVSIKLYGDKRFEDGKLSADQSWTEVYNDMVRKHNEKVDEIELASKKKADEFDNKRREADARINALLSDLRKKSSQTQLPPKPAVLTMEAMTCQGENNTTFQLYNKGNGLITMPLGVTFSNTWNAINKEATR